ncbi:MAG: hypothetical protein ACKO7Z_11745, partial [Cyanobacteriota bacterium]
ARAAAAAQRTAGSSWPKGWTLGLSELAQGDLSPAVVLPVIGWWLFWPSLLLALSSALGYLRRH